MLLELESVQKRFGGVQALKSGSLRVEPGQVHLLMGENGAGKSTLMKIVAGMVRRDGGRMLWRGNEIFPKSPSDSSALGIAMVHQESLLAPHLTVAENIFMGRQPRWVSLRGMVRDAARLIEDYGFPLHPESRVDRLSPAGRQLVEICRAVHNGSSLLIFDEPTSSLSVEETEAVFRIVRGLRDRGMGIVYITHRLEELRVVGDWVTVLRDGATVHQGPLSAIATAQLIAHMVGRPVESIYSRHPCTPGPVLLEAKNLSSPKLRGVSLSLRAGEIVGMAGLIGAGRTELCEALFGAEPIHAGTILVNGRPIEIRSPKRAVAAGIALLTEDRQHTGLALRLPIAVNVTMANLRAVSRWGLLRLQKQNAVTEQYIERLRIRADSPKQLAGRLSGGNQQKVVIAKWLFRHARIFLFDEPTRGIDIAAKIEVFHLMDELAKSGAAILMISSELPELLQVADRIIVMRGGKVTGELPGRTTQQEIMHLAALERGA